MNIISDASHPKPVYHGVDLFRLLAALLVIQLHCLPVGYRGLPVEPFWAVLCGTLYRGAVPFFFVASGFFTRRPSVLEWSIVLKPLNRLLPIYVAWLVIYDLLFLWLPLPPGMTLHFKITDIFTGGLAFQLWFLPVLGFSLALVGSSRLLLGKVPTFAIVLAVAAFGLLWGAYHDVLHLPGAVHRGRAYSGPLLVWIGSWIAERRIQFKVNNILPWATAAYFLAVGENFFIAALQHTHVQDNEFTLGTTALGICMFLLSASRDFPAISRGKRMFAAPSLGIYCVHAIFLWLLIPIIDRATVLGWVALSAAVSLASGATIALILRVPYLRKLSG